MSPDGISAVGNWIPDPADLVCNGEIKQAHDPLEREERVKLQLSSINLVMFLDVYSCLLILSQ